MIFGRWSLHACIIDSLQGIIAHMEGESMCSQMSERGISVSLTCGTSQTVWSFGYSNIMLYVILLNQANNSFFLQTLGYPPFCSESPQGKNS